MPDVNDFLKNQREWEFYKSKPEDWQIKVFEKNVPTWGKMSPEQRNLYRQQFWSRGEEKFDGVKKEEYPAPKEKESWADYMNRLDPPDYSRKHLVNKYVRPVTSGVTMAAGDIMGGPALGAIGYDLGEQTADTLSGEKPWGMYKPNKDNLLKGAAYSLGGRLLEPAFAGVGKAIGYGQELWNLGREGIAKRKAANLLAAERSPGAGVQEQVAKNLDKAEEIRAAGIPLNHAQATGDPNLLAAARAQMQDKGWGTARSAESVMGQNRALYDKVDEIAGVGDPQDFMAQARARQEGITGRTKEAQDALERRGTQIEPENEPMEVGSRLRDTAKEGRKASAQEAEKLKAKIPDDMRLDSTPLWDQVHEMFGDYNTLVDRLESTPAGSMRRVQTQLAPKEEFEKGGMFENGLFDANGNMTRIDKGDVLPNEITMRDLRKFQSQVTTGQRMAQARGDHELAFKFGQLDRGVNETLAGAEGAEAPLKEFQAYWRDQHVPTYRHGATGKILERDYTGQWRVADSSVGGRFFKKDSATGAAEGAESFKRAFGNDPEAVGLVRDYAAQDLLRFARNKVTDTLEPNKIATWLYDHKETLGRFGLGDTFGDFQLAAKAAKDAMGKEAEFNATALGRLLGKNTDVNKVIGELMTSGGGSKETIFRLTDLVKIGKQDPTGAALDGLRAGIARVGRQIMEAGMKDTAGVGLPKFKAFENFYKNWRQAFEVSGLYDRAALKGWDTINDALTAISRQANPHPGFTGGPTAELLSHVTTEGISKVGTALGMPGLITRMGLGWLRGQGKERVEKALADAMFGDPRYAEALSNLSTAGNKVQSRDAVDKFFNKIDALDLLTGKTAGYIGLSESKDAGKQLLHMKSPPVNPNPAQDQGSTIPGRQDGGPVEQGRPYIVGESGQEVFVPDQPGVIVPNNALQGGSGGGAGSTQSSLPSWVVPQRGTPQRPMTWDEMIHDPEAEARLKHVTDKVGDYFTDIYHKQVAPWTQKKETGLYDPFKKNEPGLYRNWMAESEPLGETPFGGGEGKMLEGMFVGPMAKGFEDIAERTGKLPLKGQFTNLFDNMPRAEIADFHTGWNVSWKGVKEAVGVGEDTIQVGGNATRSTQAIPISAAYDHPKLFEAYPDMKDVKIRFVDTDEFIGQYRPSSKEILISTQLNRSPSEARKTALHEMQHWVQEKEGFAKGGNMDTAKGTFDDVSGWKDELGKIERHLQNAEDQGLPFTFYQGNRTGPYTYSNRFERFELKSPEEIKMTLKQVKEVQKLADKILDYYKKYGSPDDDMKYDFYKRLAGEIEARDASFRSDIEPEDLTRTMPISGRQEFLQPRKGHRGEGGDLSESYTPAEANVLPHKSGWGPSRQSNKRWGSRKKVSEDE